MQSSFLIQKHEGKKMLCSINWRLNFKCKSFRVYVRICGQLKAPSNRRILCNISTTSVRVLSGVPNTEKQMKARGRRPSAFIVSRCLERLMKPEARVFEMAS